jgi:hypothetical protein
LAKDSTLRGRTSKTQATPGSWWKALAHVVLPIAVVLRLPHGGQGAQQRVIGDLLGPSLDDDVEASFPAVAARCEHALVVGAQVEGFCSPGAGAELERAVAPDRR